jgi:hypothetical protein
MQFEWNFTGLINMIFNVFSGWLFFWLSYGPWIKKCFGLLIIFVSFATQHKGNKLVNIIPEYNCLIGYHPVTRDHWSLLLSLCFHYKENHFHIFNNSLFDFCHYVFSFISPLHAFFFFFNVAILLSDILAVCIVLTR